DARVTYDWLTAVTGEATGGAGPSHAAGTGAWTGTGAGTVRDGGTAPGAATPVSTLGADPSGPGGDLWGRTLTRARIGASMHLLVRVGRWLTLALVVSFVVGLVFFLRVTGHD